MSAKVTEFRRRHGQRRLWLAVAALAALTLLSVGGAAAMTHIAHGKSGALKLQANVAANIDQCTNGSGPPQLTTCTWQNGDLNSNCVGSNARYA